MDWTIDSSKLNFNAGNYLFPEQVPSKEIKLVIENLSNVPYGVFFCDTAGVNATSSNIKTTGEVKNGATTIVNANMDYYKYISVADSTNTFDQAEMAITLSVANISTSAQSGAFKYYLNVEEYNSSLNTTEEFIKIDDSLTAVAENAYAGSTELKNVIIPSTITSIGASAFSACTGISEITIPASVTSIGAGVFDGCTALEKIIVEAHTTAGDFGDSANLPKFDGMGWYVETERHASLIYSTNKIVYELQEVPKITLSYVVSPTDALNEFIMTGFGSYAPGTEVLIYIETKGNFPFGYIFDLYGYNKSTNEWDLLVGDGQMFIAGEYLEYNLVVDEVGYTSFKIEVYKL